jgi:hypothetical protein
MMIMTISVLTTVSIIALALGGTVIKGRIPGPGSFYILHGAITKFGYTKDIIGNILRIKVGKSKLNFIVNPAHKTYLWGKPLYILSVEYGTSIHPSMWAILTALKELGRDDLIKKYLELNYDYNKLLNSMSKIQDEKKLKEAEATLKALNDELKRTEQEMRAFVDKNAQVVEVKENMQLEELKTNRQVLVVRQLDLNLIGEYSHGASAPKVTGNMDLYALQMSSVLKSDIVKFAFAVFLVLVGLAFAIMMLKSFGKPPQVNVEISPELLRHLADQTIQNTTKVVKI